MTPFDDIEALHDLASQQVSEVPSLVDALHLVEAMPYHWRAHDVHVSWREAMARGYAACGEAAAFLAAAGAREGRQVAIELVTGSPAECGPGYRHAVAVVDGVTLDPYAEKACTAPAIPIARRFL